MRIFADKCMPEFKKGEAEREAAKQAELAPYIEAALDRKKKMEPIKDDDIKEVVAFGKSIAQGKAVYTDMPKEKHKATHHAAGGIAMFTEDYAEKATAEESED